MACLNFALIASQSSANCSKLCCVIFVLPFFKVWLPKWKKNTAFSVRMRIITIVRVLLFCVIVCWKCVLMFHKFNFRQFCIVFPFYFRRQKIYWFSVCFVFWLFCLHQQFYFNFFFLSFHYLSSLYSQDLIYQSSLVRGNRKKTVQELFAFSCRPL